MLDIDLTEIIQELEEDSLIFSYTLKKLSTTDGISLTVQQEETGFSLVIQLKEIHEELSVTQFTLTEKSLLEQQSLSLYDAATVEIVLQALDLLFIIADHVDQTEITFVISPDEALHLSSFTSFFDAHFILHTSLKDYDAFVNKTETLKATIKQELWQRQRHDFYLRNYLQNSQKGHLFNHSDLISQQPQSSNIIVFPKPQTVVEHTRNEKTL